MKASTAPSATILHLPQMPRKSVFTATNRLRELREASGLKLREIAERTGTTPTHIHRLEIGARDITLAWMKTLARIYGVLPADILLEAEGGLTAEERHAVDTLRQVPAPNRAAIHGFLASQQPWRGNGEVVPLPVPAAGNDAA